MDSCTSISRRDDARIRQHSRGAYLVKPGTCARECTSGPSPTRSDTESRIAFGFTSASVKKRDRLPRKRLVLQRAARRAFPPLEAPRAQRVHLIQLDAFGSRLALDARVPAPAQCQSAAFAYRSLMQFNGLIACHALPPGGRPQIAHAGCRSACRAQRRQPPLPRQVRLLAVIACVRRLKKRRGPGDRQEEA